MSPRRHQLRMSLWLSEELEPLQLAEDEYVDGEHTATWVSGFGEHCPLTFGMATLLARAQAWKAGLALAGEQLELLADELPEELP